MAGRLTPLVLLLLAPSLFAANGEDVLTGWVLDAVAHVRLQDSMAHLGKPKSE